MSNNNDFLNDLFSAYKNTSSYKDSCVMDFVLNKQKYEQNLNEMWKIYSGGCIEQLAEYQKGIRQIKSVGLKVLRNSQGDHKIVTPD